MSVIKNLLQYSTSDRLENHVIHAINPSIVPAFKIEAIEGAASQQVFRYSPNDNFYYTCTQLKKLLLDEKAVIVAHDWVELGMASNLGLQNPVVQFLHGDYDYYYQLAVKHEQAIDLFVPVAKSIETTLKKRLPERAADIRYLRFPVPDVANGEEVGVENIVFIGRPENAKGYHLLPAIAKRLKEKSISLRWHIVGSDGLHEMDKAGWESGIEVKHYGTMPNEKVLVLLKKMQVFILPSLREGMPVALIEAMKAGVIPVVNDIDGGIQELVINSETGFKIENNTVESYEERISDLITNNDTAKRLRQNCICLANRLFDPFNNTKNLEEALIGLVKINKERKPSIKVYGSRLDKRWIPYWVTKYYRKQQAQ